MVEAVYFRNHKGTYYDAIQYLWKNITLIKLRDITSIIDYFSADNPHGKSLLTNRNVLFLVRFISIDQIPKIKILYMVASEYPEVIEGCRRLIATGVIDPEE